MRFFSSFSSTRDRLTRLGPSEPLSRLSLFVIVLLDIFVLATLFQGLSSVTDQVASPNDRFPSLCRGVFALDSTSLALPQETERDRRLRLMDAYADGSIYDFGRYGEEPPHEACTAIEGAARTLTQANWFHAARERIEAADLRKSQAERRIADLEGSYDSSLLERIAEQPREDSILPSDAGSVRAGIERERTTMSEAESEIEAGQAAIVALPEWTALWNLADARTAETRDAYASLEFWYPIILLLAQFAFLAPVLFIAAGAYTWALRRDSGIAILLCAHLLVVAIIPIFIKLVQFALDLLPERLFALVMEFLREYDIVVVFNYVLIVVAILVTLALVYFIQRRWFSLDRLRAKRLESGACTSCGRALPRDFGIIRHCVFCGESQVASCDACGAETKRHASHCGHCGAETDQSR